MIGRAEIPRRCLPNLGKLPYDPTASPNPFTSNIERTSTVTKIDQALEACRQNVSAQPVFYDLFLNSLFFIPTVEDEENKSEAGAIPLLVEAEGNEYLMLFDTIKRLTDWAEDGAKYVALPGHAIAEMSIPNLYWAMNYGTEHQKQFEPEEITWLKDIVRQSKEDESAQKDA